MTESEEPQDSLFDLTAKIEAAFWQASLKVVERAKQTGTPIVVWRDGRVVCIPADEFELKPHPPRNLATNPPTPANRQAPATSTAPTGEDVANNPALENADRPVAED